MARAGGELVSEVLRDYGAVARRHMQRYLTQRSGAELYELAQDYPKRGGRSLRASFCLATARAFGASLEQALDSAIALELLHNAFLVHDDIEDDSEERRGAPTLHRLHDVPTAINVGDALVAMSFRPLLYNHKTLGPRLAWKIAEETERMARESVEGQALELSWRRGNRTELADEDYLQMILKKTCWYTTIYPARVGALIGARAELSSHSYVRFGFFLGAAFQIQDDLLNLVGDHERYLKELNGDLWEGKRTLMLLHLSRNASAGERARLEGILALPRVERRARDIRWMRSRMDAYGSIEYARGVAHALAGAALHEFELDFGALPPSRDKAFIEALPYWVLERS